MGHPDLEDRIRTICLALPGVTERTSHGAPAFFAGKPFLMLWLDGHHGDPFPHMWCAAPPGAPAELVATEPERFFRPPYVGGRGWIGVRLDGAIDWTEMAAVCREAFRTVAPKKLVAGWAGEEPPEPPPEAGGDPACWAGLICPECDGVLGDGDGHRPGCPAARGRERKRRLGR